MKCRLHPLLISQLSFVIKSIQKLILHQSKFRSISQITYYSLADRGTQLGYFIKGIINVSNCFRSARGAARTRSAHAPAKPLDSAPPETVISRAVRHNVVQLPVGCRPLSEISTNISSTLIISRFTLSEKKVLDVSVEVSVILLSRSLLFDDRCHVTKAKRKLGWEMRLSNSRI